MQLTEFNKRLIATVISSSLLIFLFSIALTKIGSWLFFLSLFSLTAVGIWEYQQFCKKKGIILLFYPVVVGAFFLLLSFFTACYSSLWPIFLTLFSLMAIHLQNPKNSLENIASSSFAFFYIAVPMGLFLSILYHLPATESGLLWVVYLLFTTKGTDVGAYLGGKLLGKHKLIPKVSPGKTIEGTLCGICFATLISFLFVKITSLPFTFFQSIWVGFILAVVSQFGDLVESLFKRDAGVKDSNVLFGFGGVLDMIDSLLCTTPLLYLILGSVI